MPWLLKLRKQFCTEAIEKAEIHAKQRSVFYESIFPMDKIISGFTMFISNHTIIHFEIFLLLSLQYFHFKIIMTMQATLPSLNYQWLTFYKNLTIFTTLQCLTQHFSWKQTTFFHGNKQWLHFKKLSTFSTSVKFHTQYFLHFIFILLQMLENK